MKTGLKNQKVYGKRFFTHHIQVMRPHLPGRHISARASQLKLPQTSAFQSLFPHLLSVDEVA